jgi:hypothetical protein
MPRQFRRKLISDPNISPHPSIEERFHGIQGIPLLTGDLKRTFVPVPFHLHREAPLAGLSTERSIAISNHFGIRNPTRHQQQLALDSRDGFKVKYPSGGQRWSWDYGCI